MKHNKDNFIFHFKIYEMIRAKIKNGYLCYHDPDLFLTEENIIDFYDYIENVIEKWDEVSERMGEQFNWDQMKHLVHLWVKYKDDRLFDLAEEKK